MKDEYVAKIEEEVRELTEAILSGCEGCMGENPINWEPGRWFHLVSEADDAAIWEQTCELNPLQRLAVYGREQLASAVIAEVEAHKTEAGGWTRDSLAYLNVSWPPPRGWKERLLDWAIRGISASVDMPTR